MNISSFIELRIDVPDASAKPSRGTGWKLDLEAQLRGIGPTDYCFVRNGHRFLSLVPAAPKSVAVTKLHRIIIRCKSEFALDPRLDILHTCKMKGSIGAKAALLSET